MTIKIFISYRRQDSQFFTDIVHDYMQRHFGEENVFLDVGSIPFGVDFRVFLAKQIAEHDVVLVIIGPEWGRIMQERAGQENDFVRIEIENALKQGKLVIPVLVMEAQMPDFRDLPASIADLQWRNSATIRRKPDLVNDCNRLADGIRQYMQTIAAPPPAPAKPTSPSLMPAPFAWIEIPGGRGTMKTNESGVTLTIPTETYWISKYPITNAQFAKFIEADGYKQQKWWTQAGWEAKAKGWVWSGSEWKETGKAWTQPRYWTDSKWNGAEQPVVGVSWYEAVAFCLWLSETTGEKIMLPTEDQWQYAAQGDDGRAYPWGNDWDCKRCNNSVKPCDSNVTTPVRQYEGKTKGDSPFGVVDMAGNVWEWCLTDYDNNTNDINSSTTGRVLRGGSWNYVDTDWFRCDYRDGDTPRDRNYDWGFRISRS